jgi:hypothetical protein
MEPGVSDAIASQLASLANFRSQGAKGFMLLMFLGVFGFWSLRGRVIKG